MKAHRGITGFFPYVDDETRNIIQRAMNEAKDYREFREILCDIVCSEEVNDLTTYFAYSFAGNHHYLIQRLQDAGKHSTLVDSVLMHNMKSYTTWRDSKAVIARSIEAAPNDWLACGFYLGWRLSVEGTFYRGFPESASDFTAFDVMERRIEKILSVP